MKVLLTGATGFLGSEVFDYLKSDKNNLITIVGRSKRNDVICDLSSESPEIKEVYDTIVHIAGKAHSIPKKKEEEEVFYNVNHKGTKNLLDSLKNKSPKTIVFISSVAVYGKDFGEMINESYPLEGKTPYAKSKILAEKEIISFSEKNNINYFILRLPLISGVNPPGNLGKMMKAIKKGYYFRIGKGLAKKSIVSSNDVAQLICSLQDNKSGIYNLTDRINPTFRDIENHIARLHNKKIISLPKIIFTFLAKIGDILPFFIINTNKLKKITDSLTFSDQKAVDELGWEPTSALESIQNN